jgi:transcriptional regulator with XRE-family HTH domain
MLFKTALGYVMRTERLKQGLGLRDVCKKAFIALSYLSEVERGQKDASSEMVEVIASALGMPTSELIRQTYEVMFDWEQQKENLWDSQLTKMSTN